jgi:hypothetical protein
MPEYLDEHGIPIGNCFEPPSTERLRTVRRNLTHLTGISERHPLADLTRSIGLDNDTMTISELHGRNDFSFDSGYHMRVAMALTSTHPWGIAPILPDALFQYLCKFLNEGFFRDSSWPSKAALVLVEQFDKLPQDAIFDIMG